MPLESVDTRRALNQFSAGEVMRLSVSLAGDHDIGVIGAPIWMKAILERHLC